MEFQYGHEKKPAVLSAIIPDTIENILATKLNLKDKEYIYINGWSFIHFLSGVIIGYYLSNLDTLHYYLYLFIIHSIWEVFQIVVHITPMKKESIYDITLDTLFFLLGGYVYSKYSK